MHVSLCCTGKPQSIGYSAVCPSDDVAAVDKIGFLSDQLAVLCAEVATLQQRAIAATEDAERELEDVGPDSPMLRQAEKAGNKGKVSVNLTVYSIWCYVFLQWCGVCEI
jgi:hypothetical protein